MSGGDGYSTLEETTDWLVGPVRLERDWLVLDRAQAGRYVSPYGIPLLPFELAAVRSPKAALAVAERFGLLYHGPRTPEGEDFREHYSEWESLALALTEVVRLAQGLRDAAAGDTAALAGLRAHMETRVPPEWIESDELLLDAVDRRVAALMNRGLAGSTRQIISSRVANQRSIATHGRPVEVPLGSYLFYTIAPSLAGYAYARLALLLVNRVPMRSCGQCDKVFAADDPRQQFCSPSCAARSRQRRWRQHRTQTSPQ